MEDELDDKVIYETYVSHMKLLSRIVWSIPINFNLISPVSFLAYFWRILKLYVLKPEILIFGSIGIIILMYFQTLDVWSRSVLGRLQYTFGKQSRSRIQRLGVFSNSDIDKSTWELKVGAMAAYAMQGRRPTMEDRFVVNENINNTGVGLLAIFDGHGGEFAANYAKDKLIPNLYTKVQQIKDIIQGKKPVSDMLQPCKEQEQEKPKTPVQRKKSFKKPATTDECIKKGAKEITDAELLKKLDNLQRPITRQVRTTQIALLKDIPVHNYLDKMGIIDFGKLLTDEVLAADHKLLEVAKKNYDVAGTTALIAVLEGSKLYVANVGDSRAVMCDSRGNVIPLSFDHKPQQMRELKRIKEAGGFVSFNGVWRVAGILATSRALGDYPLKDKKLVIADPDILSFDLNDHKPMFVILASDGLWDTFSNEEAIAFIKERLHEPDYGARSITLQSYYRGSLDNITVIIINFKDSSFSWNK